MSKAVEAQMVLRELERLTEQVRGLVLKQPELREPVTFSVWPRESDPHQAGPLYVEMDQNGARLWWLGTERDDSPEAVVCWSALRHFLEIEDAIPDLEAMRDDLVREVEMYRRMAHRYRHASASMKRKYEGYVATLPPEVPRLAAEPV